MTPTSDSALERLTDRVVDATPIDWDAEDTSFTPDLRGRVDALRLLTTIGDAHRIVDEPEADRTILFEWGGLRVLEKIGEGSFGDVYRAFDPLLRRQVALKLWRGSASEKPLMARRILEEAGRLARVRHPNVPVIHGARTEDDRVGFWTDLLFGRSLDSRLSNGERFGAVEAAAIGMDVTGALTAVHGAGLVHGDVTAANVMREPDGRCVLVDFGAGSEQPADPDAPVSPAFGTPLALAPETLAGQPASAGSDLYAVGVLLFRLVTGRFPVTASTLVELRARHLAGERANLRDLRHDLPESFVAVVDRALEPAPSDRFATAGDMLGALRESLADAHARPRDGSDPARPAATVSGAPPSRSPLPLLGFIVALVAVIALVVGRPHAPWLDPAPLRAPSTSTGAAPVALDVELSFLRSRGGARDVLPAGSMVRPGDALFMEVELGQTSYVYVLNGDQAGDVYVLFPTPELDLGNPLSASRHRLPGPVDGEMLDWQVTSGRGYESFLVVVARDRLTALERAIADLPRASTGASVSAAPLDIAALTGHRGVGGLTPSAGESGGEHEGLTRLARYLESSSAEPGTMRIRQFSLYNVGS